MNIVVFFVALAQFLDPVFKAYYWVGVGTTVLIASILLVRCAWRIEALFRRLVAIRARAAGE